MKYSCIQGSKTEPISASKTGTFFRFPAGIFKILRIPEESYTLLYFTRKNICSKKEKNNLGYNYGCQRRSHYHSLKHALKYLYHTKDDGLYLWRTHPRMELPEGPLPTVNSTRQDILLDNRPQFDAHIAHAYADSNWATCTKTQRSFGGTCIQLAGDTIAYKCKFQPTIAGSSTEAKFMAAYDTGKMILFIQSVLWDLHVPQEAATVLFKDNGGCTAMGNAQTPTSRTRHINIKYFSLCNWMKRDLMFLEHIDTSFNMSDNMTKGLQTILFHRHRDFILGHV